MKYKLYRDKRLKVKDASKLLPGLIFCLLVSSGLIYPLSAFARAVKVIPLKDPATENRVLSLYRQASSLYKKGDKVSSRKLLEHAAKFDQTGMSPYVHSLLSQIYYELSNPKSAMEHAIVSLKYNPKQKRLIHNLALYAKEANQYDKAIAYLELYKKKSRFSSKKEVDGLIGRLKVEQKSANQFPLDKEDYLDKLTYEDSVNKWPKAKLPLTVYIQNSSTAKGFKPNFPKIAKDSFIDWYKASNRKIAFKFVNSSENASIKLSWTDNRLRTTDDKKERLKAGITRSRITESGVIKDAHIQIRTLDPFSKKGIDNDKIMSTCLHEVGHALGLNGHSSNHADIMYMGVNQRQFPALTKRDKKTIQKLYSAYSKLAMKGVPEDSPPEKQIAKTTKTIPNVSSPQSTNGMMVQMTPQARQPVYAQMNGVRRQQYVQTQPMLQYMPPGYSPVARQPYQPVYQAMPYQSQQMVPVWQANIPVQPTAPYYIPQPRMQAPYAPPQYQYVQQPIPVPPQGYQVPNPGYTYAPPAIQMNQATPYAQPQNYQQKKPANQFQMIDNIFQNFKPMIQQFSNSGNQTGMN